MGVEISLTGKNAIVTGGGGGMGRCTARMLARAGANVLVSDMDGAEAEETVAQIKAGKRCEGTVYGLQCDQQGGH